jgi:hypothetical protein
VRRRTCTVYSVFLVGMGQPVQVVRGWELAELDVREDRYLASTARVNYPKPN